MMPMVAVATLPALSVQVPLTLVAAALGPAYVVGAVHDAIPENELPWKLTLTGWLYQPFKSGGRARVAVAVGVEVSTWRVYCWLAVDGDGPDHIAEQDTPLILSVFMRYAIPRRHPEVLSGGGAAFHVTVSELGYQIVESHDCD